MAHNHLIVEDSAFSLSTIDNHAFLEGSSSVILASSGREASGLALHHLSLVSVKFDQLVSALSDLSLLIEHETASECVNLAVKGH